MVLPRTVLSRPFWPLPAHKHTVREPRLRHRVQTEPLQYRPILFYRTSSLKILTHLICDRTSIGFAAHIRLDHNAQKSYSLAILHGWVRELFR